MATIYAHAPTPKPAPTKIDIRPTEIIRPRWPELLGLTVINLMYLIGNSIGEDAIEYTNFIGPTLLCLLMAYGAATMVRTNIAAIWTPLLWVRVTLILYFGVGSLVPIFVNEDTAELMSSFYYFFPQDVAKYNLICGVFVLVLFFVVAFFGGLLKSYTNGKAGDLFGWRPRPSGPSLRFMALLFLGVGTIVKYGFMLPFVMGWTDESAPQLIAQLAMATWIGYFLLIYSSLRDKSPLLYVAISLGVLEAIFGMLELAKISVLFPLIMMAMGFIYYRPNIRLIAVMFGSIAALYLLIAPVITYSRNVITDKYGTGWSAPLGERWSALISYTPERAQELEEKDYQLGWVRLSYVNAGSFAINQYDAGMPGNSLSYAYAALIPRFLYPGKPNMAQVGRDFNVAVNGNENSLSSPSMPAELYWNAGWPGVVIGAAFAGMLFTILSIYSITVMQVGAYHLLFIVLLNMRMGVTLDGFMVNGLIGPLVILVIAHVLLTFINGLSEKKG